MQTLLVVAFSGLLFTALPIYAAPTVQILLSSQNPSVGEPACGSQANYYTYTMVVEDGKSVLTRYDFCSPGRPDAEVVTDAVGNNFILLKYSAGSGTTIAVKLRVFELPSKRENLGRYWGLTEYMTVPIDATSGPQSEWEYKYKVEKPTCGGLRFLFTRVVAGHGEIDSIPGQKTRIIEIGVPSKCSP
ncbi:MAG: hypothetical protein ACRESE_02035 [Gammaproteobacteria bacterium]